MYSVNISPVPQSTSVVNNKKAQTAAWASNSSDLRSTQHGCGGRIWTSDLRVMLTTTVFTASIICLWSGLYLHPKLFLRLGAYHLVSTPLHLICEFGSVLPWEKVSPNLISYQPIIADWSAQLFSWARRATRLLYPAILVFSVFVFKDLVIISLVIILIWI